ncbi:MAG: hypothetical protein WC827_00200 [Candidatus Paceibacterota bacterium]|jgi:hypothetical protein
MNKKTLWIGSIVLIFIIIGAVLISLKKVDMTDIGGIGKKSIMDEAREKGETVMSKSEYMDGCSKSSLDMKDACYAMGAFYYRDASFCKKISKTDTSQECNQENIEKMYEDLKNGISPFTPPKTLLDEEKDFDIGREPETLGNIYGSIKEVVSPSAFASEIKSILSEACGGAKLSQVLKDPISGSDIFVYVWKNEPTAENLESSFGKKGYTIEMSGESLLVKKGNLVVSISWMEEVGSQEIGVMFYTEE